MKSIKRIASAIASAIATPFTMIAVLIDDSRRINEDGSWDKYWARKNKK